jgi:hypothetical protein
MSQSISRDDGELLLFGAYTQELVDLHTELTLSDSSDDKQK